MVFDPNICETSHIKTCVTGEAFKYAYYTTQFAQRDGDYEGPAPFKSSDMGGRKNKRMGSRTVVTTLKTMHLHVNRVL